MLLDAAIGGVSAAIGYGVSKAVQSFQNGLRVSKSGTLTNIGWSGYPSGGPKPTGPLRVLEGEEYSLARAAANRANAAIHRAAPWLEGLEIHEIQPVKFGEDPVALSNKIALHPSIHQQYTSWWSNLWKSLGK